MSIHGSQHLGEATDGGTDEELESIDLIQIELTSVSINQSTSPGLAQPE